MRHLHISAGWQPPLALSDSTLVNAALTCAQTLLAILFLVSLSAQASDAVPPGVEWSALTVAQQNSLHRFQDRWSQLPPDRQTSLAEGTQYWLTMTPAQRIHTQAQLQRWHRLPPEQRSVMLDRVREFRTLLPPAQQQVRDQFQRFSRLSPERREQLKARWHALTPQQRSQASASLQRMPATHND